ncbi:hypothetical protein [Burkholderia pseudomallei]|uniref:hypothetical protein n=1 Tax=Burkholderia pseudomallei TaxID=28450 RepID=UPI0012B6FCFE|nr:hypothetical protein [Burkholderia pseudomallei]MBM5690141.1 hypothetical protein [Burkholderia pseudomallei]MCW0142659.1 hypothetical protein [Burkholderia pseudomallei]MWJ57386.1 hypothetical protein [Burkholderia pseudomallei]
MYLYKSVEFLRKAIFPISIRPFIQIDEIIHFEPAIYIPLQIPASDIHAEEYFIFNIRIFYGYFENRIDRGREKILRREARAARAAARASLKTGEDRRRTRRSHA